MTYSEDDTRALGSEFARALPEQSFVAFSGDLGSGKTAFIRGMCDVFDCAAQVSSPTFAIVNEYVGSRDVTHCDLYRLDSVEAMLQIGLDSVFAGRGTVLVEWAERALPLLPVPRYDVVASYGDTADARRFSIRSIENEKSESILVAPAQLFRRRT